MDFDKIKEEVAKHNEEYRSHLEKKEKLIEKEKVEIHDVEIELEEYESICMTLNCKVGTNGKQGGDTGYGGRTYISIEQNGGGHYNFEVEDNKLIIEAGGDWELEDLAEIFQNISKYLNGNK